MNKKKMAVLTGAGVSAESGISTFRDSDGLWENYDVSEVCDISAWPRNPGLMLRFYNERRAQLATVKPNAAHLAIASLEEDYDVTVVTQNVDNLHERAGSTKIIHLHGELTKVRPEDSYNENDGFSTSKVIDVGYEPVNLGDLSPDGVQLRPHIVWFGEAVPNIGRAIEAVEQADILLIVGTQAVRDRRQRAGDQRKGRFCSRRAFGRIIWPDCRWESIRRCRRRACLTRRHRNAGLRRGRHGRGRGHGRRRLLHQHAQAL